MEKRGVDVPARTGLRVVYLDTDAKTNGTIKLNSSQTPVARSPPLSLPGIHLLSIEVPRSLRTCTRCVSPLARVSPPLLNRVSIQIFPFMIYIF